MAYNLKLGNFYSSHVSIRMILAKCKFMEIFILLPVTNMLITEDTATPLAKRIQSWTV